MVSFWRLARSCTRKLASDSVLFHAYRVGLIAMHNERPLQDLIDDTSGLVITEYIILLTVVTTMAGMALVGIGIPFWESFALTQSLVAAPVP